MSEIAAQVHVMRLLPAARSQNPSTPQFPWCAYEPPSALIDCNNSEIVTAVGSATIKARLNTLIRPSTRSRPAAAAAAAVPV